MLIKQNFFSKHNIKISPVQKIAIGFILVILTGAFLLSLPISSRAGVSTSLVNALFTASSATCVTGLVVFDTYQYWSGFGQMIILLLIQIGGLGFMTVATLFSFFINRNISVTERIVMSKSFGLNDLSGVVRLAKHVLIGTFLIELIGAIILSTQFIGEFGVIGGIIKSIFHSISAFCNSGFDIIGQKAAYIGLTPYVSNATICITIMGLVVIGGLGFFVWEDLYNYFRKKITKLSTYTKLVLVITGILIFAGALLIFLFEFNNPGTMKNLSLKGKFLSSFFHSITPRTAGFNTLEIPNMTENSKVLTMILMFIGGSSGSTAGGIKTVTVGLILIAVFQIARGRRNIVISNRKISNDNLLRALSIFMIGLLMVLVGSFVLNTIEPNLDYFVCLFECISAFGTVGLTFGITPELNSLSKLVLILLMYFGRVGILTITFSIVLGMDKNKQKLSFPETNVMIG